MSSCTNARESENAMRDILISTRHVLVMDAFAKKSTLAFLKAYLSEDIHIVNNRYQPRVDEMRVTIISTGVVMARALVEKHISYLNLIIRLLEPIHIMGIWMESKDKKTFLILMILDCIAYTNTMEADISFEIIGHFDIVIAITNIATLIHVEALAQMLY
ncbi:13246_t:CDS:2 [Funneliformis geosporum]|nr:13246_t:CDS:2 [Funneliformis geosporum]